MVRTPFLFVAGTAALDLLNTELMLDGSPADLLQSGDDLLAWIAESGLATNPQMRALRAAREARQSWLEASLRLRAAMRASFARLAGGESLRDADLRAINEVLTSTEGTLRIERGDAAVSLAFEPRSVTPAYLIARAASEFLSTANLALVRRCEGEGCILFFYDTTKSHTRRWCTMAACGNRSKVKAHYVRKRGET